MNISRINELINLISSLKKDLKELNERKENLEKEARNTKKAQEKMDYAVSTARSRVSALSSFGVRAEFLEDIFSPVFNRPDCIGIQTTVENEISGTERSIKQTNNSILLADQEKRLLETEEVV